MMYRVRPYRLVVLALVAGVLLLTMASVAASLVGEPVSNFTRDAVAVADIPWYRGSISLITCMVWATAAALSFFVAWVLPPVRRRMLSLGGFTLLLGIDDAMLVHDQIGPGHGVPEILFPATYAVLALVLLREMLRSGTRSTTAVFLLGAALLAASVAFDTVFHDLSVLAEDGAKLLGALVWATVPVLAYREQSTLRPSRTTFDAGLPTTGPVLAEHGAELLGALVWATVPVLVDREQTTASRA